VRTLFLPLPSLAKVCIIAAMTDQAYRLVALAIGVAARILVKYGYTQGQSAELMRRAWRIVQESK